MEIEYEVTQRRHHRSASAPSTLMQRIQKGPLIERLGRAETQAKESFTCVGFFLSNVRCCVPWTDAGDAWVQGGRARTRY